MLSSRDSLSRSIPDHLKYQYLVAYVRRWEELVNSENHEEGVNYAPYSESPSCRGQPQVPLVRNFLLVYLEYFMERLLETTIKANAMALMYCYFLGQDSPSSNTPGSSED